LAVFSIGYVAMSRKIVNAGAFYTYITLGIGKSSGVAAAFVAVAGYNAMQIGLYEAGWPRTPPWTWPASRAGGVCGRCSDGRRCGDPPPADEPVPVLRASASPNRWSGWRGRGADTDVGAAQGVVRRERPAHRRTTPSAPAIPLRSCEALDR
jgi:hypothetical protein